MLRFCGFFARSGVGRSALLTNDSTSSEGSGILMARLLADFFVTRWSGESPVTDSLTGSFCAEPDAARLPAEVLSAAEDLRVNGDARLDDEVLVGEDVLVDDESPVEDGEPDGSAYAIPGVVA